MKLLDKKEVKNRVQKENESLMEENGKLRILNQRARNLLGLDFSAEKQKQLKEFQQFTDDIINKKSNLLKELTDINDIISKRRDILYGLIEKQDQLIERENAVKEREAKVELRERFVKEIENKQHGM